MRTYFIVIAVMTIVCMSCTTREEREVKALMTAVFQKDLDDGREIIVFEDALTDWSIPEQDTCTAESILNLERNFSSRLASVEIRDIFSKEDAKKICKEGREAFSFQKEMFPEGVHVSPDRSRYDSIRDAFYRHIGEPEIVELDTELRTYSKYKAISKPVFLQGYRYAFLYIESGGDISVYQKKNGNWEHLLMVTFTLS